MKIIEALKELPVLEKRIAKQSQQIADYAGLSSQEESPFGTREEHLKRVTALVQSNFDLAARYAKLKRALAVTNATVKVGIAGETKTIAEWIVFKDKTGDQLKFTLNALNLDRVQRRLRDTPVDITQGVKIERMYNEDEKNALLEAVRAQEDGIDAALEITNATTDLLEM